MSFIGCTGWLDLTSRTGLVMDEPPGLLVAYLSESFARNRNHDLTVIWKEDGGYRVMLHLPSADFDASPEIHGDESAFELMMRWSADYIIQAAGHPSHMRGFSAVLSTLLFAEAGNIARRLGVRIGWTVEGTTGSYDEIYTHTHAVYTDLAVAVSHAAAAEAHEYAQDVSDYSWDGPVYWGIGWVPLRETVPEYLKAFASGSVPPPRAELLQVADEADGARSYVVTVPLRGEVEFRGTDAEEASSAFFVSQPTAKVPFRIRISAEQWNPGAMAEPVSGDTVIWGCCRSWISEEVQVQTAVASGLDAPGLAADLARLIVTSAADYASRKSSSREPDNAEEDPGDDGTDA